MKLKLSFCLIVCLLNTFKLFSACVEGTPQRVFIAHRGVNMRYTITGENSLEGIGLSKVAGFKAIETDVRLSADSILVIMHDATLNRTCLNADGTKIEEEVKVGDKTLFQLKNDYILKASRPEYRTRIPTLKEYLRVCKENDLLVFIEPKLNDVSGKYYRTIIETADEVLGRGNYIITSNNFANLQIRRMGIMDVRLMGILYQTTFAEIEKLENVIMAISTNRLERSEYTTAVRKSLNKGIETESHADDYEHFDKINNESINYVSTDFLAPDYIGQGTTVYWGKSGRNPNGIKKLSRKCSVLPDVAYGAIYLEMLFEGSAIVKLGKQSFDIKSTEGGQKLVKHQVLLFNEHPDFLFSDLSDDFKVVKASVRVVAFE